MKLTVIGSAYPYRGGLSAYNERLARELQEAGHEVRIHTFTLRIPPTNPILRKPKRKLNFEAKTIWTEEGILDTAYQVLLRHAG